MMNRLLFAFVVLALVSCVALNGPATGTEYRGEPLAVVRGRMTADRNISIVGDVRLAIGWFTASKPGAGRPDDVYSESVIYEPVFPAGFEFGLYELPKVTGGTVVGPGDLSAAAVGILFAYDDRNQNGMLDRYRAGEQPVDQVLGASLGTTATAEGYFIAFVDEPGSVRRGLNLVRADGEVVGFDTQVPVHLDASKFWNVLMCEDFLSADGGSACFDTTQPAFDAGVQSDAGSSLSISGSVGLVSGSRFVNVSVRVNNVDRPDASVSINGVPIPYDATRGAFALSNGPPSSIVAGAENVLSAQASDAPPLSVTFQMPGTFSITTPAFNASLASNTPFDVAWTESQDAGSYRVTVYRSAPFAQLYNAPGLSSSPFTVPGVAYQGNGTLNVEASVPNVTTPNGTLIVPYVNQSIPLVFQ